MSRKLKTRAQRSAQAREAVNARWAQARAKAAKVGAKAAVAPQRAIAVAPARGRIHDDAVTLSRIKPQPAGKDIFTPAMFPPSAMPPKARQMAQDAELTEAGAWAWSAMQGMIYEGQTFLGYPYLSALAQRPEYRRMVEQLAFHMTRRWITLKSTAGDDPPGPPMEAMRKPPPAIGVPAEPGAEPEVDSNGLDPAKVEQARADMEAAGRQVVSNAKAQRIKELEAELKRLRVRDLFKEVAEHDGFFGRGHIYVDLGTTEMANELLTPIGNGKDDTSKVKVAKGTLKGLKTVEPIWAYPMQYESVDPLKPGWYRPDHWYVMRRQVHRTRLLTFISREVPDMLKPAYAFGGLPLTQMARPYVDNWLRTRQSVSDLINSFTQFVLQTDLLPQLATEEGSAGFYKRLDAFTNTRNNRGVMAVDKEREDLKNVSAPLGSLDKLQAQSQEQMSSVSGIPIMFLLGDQPTGLNASSEGSIRAFYDWVHAGQEFLFAKPLDTIIAFAMLNIWGEIDEDITYEFTPLWTPTEKEKSLMQKSDADRDGVYMADGVIAADEVRKKLARDPNSGYDLDLEREIAPPAPPVPPMPGMPGAEAAGGAPGEPGAKAPPFGKKNGAGAPPARPPVVK